MEPLLLSLGSATVVSPIRKPISFSLRKPTYPTIIHFRPSTHKAYRLYRKPCSAIDNSNKEPSPTSEQENEVDNLGVKAALSILRFYKREISPLMLNSCRYVPTCSEYSMIAYKKYGFVKGSILTTWRICRCNPLGGSGFDPPRWFNESTLDE
ncbi:UPF0161 protein At3g09310 [Impatiens glandulifera]|uniref:UPF0161 protein At3g09310 n=1 Tax=Impatiens glandulifera TaxID=253017 RepID=UPI001FB100B1|nr:UPF0161 protein At3g09310 [Impatiens glandulifera]XP_047340761.1 UPF0161 protein At3g09310 [Impatiens glandulifera]